MEACQVYQLCTEDDDYVRERVRWVVELSDGLTVYEDDDRPGVEERSSWIRLKRYCEEQGVTITAMRMQFRSHHVPLSAGKDGYYFAWTASYDFGGSTVPVGGVKVGWLEGRTLHLTHYRIPELEPSDFELRQADFTVDSLIAVEVSAV